MSTYRLHVEITQPDIDQGTPESPWFAADALAITRAIHDQLPTWQQGWAVVCDPHAIKFTDQNGREFVWTPPEFLAEWMNQYDARGPAGVEPITFDLELAV